MTTYTKDPHGNEQYTPTSGVDTVQYGRYAKDKTNKPFYPKDASRSEFLDTSVGLIERDGEYVYPQLSAGKPNYPKETVTGNKKKEVYVKGGGQWIIGRGLDGHQYYAKDESDHEYYPEDNTPAKQSDGSIKYAKTAAAATRFPRDANNNEFYLTLIDPSRAHTIPSQYAKQANGDEIYPMIQTSDGFESEYILGTEYAKRGGKKYYPKDGNNNEFYLAVGGAAEKLLDAYAVTNDGNVILPQVGGRFHINAALQPPVLQAQVVGRLFREKYILSNDYLTFVQVAVKPTITPKRYSYRDTLTYVTIHVIPPGASLTAAPVPSTSSGKVVAAA